MSTDAEMLSTNPVAGYTIKRARDYNALVLTFQYMSSPGQKPEEAHESPNYILTQAQAIDFAKKLLHSAEHYPGPDSAQSIPGPR